MRHCFKINYILAIVFTVFVCQFYGAQGWTLRAAKNQNSSNGFTPAPNKKLFVSNLMKKCDPCPKGILCVPPIQCPAHVQMKAGERPQLCDLTSGSHGFCCTTGQNHTAEHHRLEKAKLRASDGDDNTATTAILEAAKAQLAKLMTSEESMARSIERGHPEYMHNMGFRTSMPHHFDMMSTISLSHRGIQEMLASRIYKDKQQISTIDFQLNHISVPFEGTEMEKNCPRLPVCPPMPLKYRTVNGDCNNPHPQRVTWGSAGHPMERLLPPAYEDGIWSPRVRSVDGSPLASPRAISLELLKDVDRPHETHNLLVMQFGQLLSHDITQSASITLGDGKGVSCCTEDGSQLLPPQARHYACMPISIGQDDVFYRTFNQGCINFVRSSLAPSPHCRLGYSKQLSKVTHYLDASFIYGSNLKTLNDVRSFQQGKLRMFNDYGRELLPMTREHDACLSMEKGNACFLAGDGRSNQIITLTALHILFAREHNRIADALSNINPHWPDEMLFEETRKIVIAEYQHIIYNEWLPLIIGTETMNRFGLNPLEHGFSSDYSPDINACITNEFSAAAFRFGHSTVDGKLNVHKGEDLDEIIDIPEVMFNPSRLRQRQFLDEIIKTLVNQPMQQVDASITMGLSRYLFRGGNPFGLDLAALNIQRGRDHGLRPYNDYLEVSGRKRVHDFIEFGHEMAAQLAHVYKHPDDMDLWIGGLLETAVDDSLVGPTFSEIIADQFSRFRRGDRYFYEHNSDINPGHFTPEQIHEIRHTSMARLICDNTDGISLLMQSPHAFLRSDLHGNEQISCGTGALPTVNLNAWREV